MEDNPDLMHLPKTDKGFGEESTENCYRLLCQKDCQSNAKKVNYAFNLLPRQLNYGQLYS